MNRPYDAPPPMTIDPSGTYRAVIHTEKGDITIRLLADVAPVTVNNFVFLARDGFYDGCTFHRVVPGFVAQGGDPTGSGRGGPGYRFDDELSETPFEQGVLGMANAGPNTNGSQFYLMLGDAPHLHGRYTAFGRVEQGIEVALALRHRDPASDPAPGDRIDSIEILQG
ncbi:MAG: peptidylprolyl isomerase [Chloroflexi bacterium]|nr:peptidylprolyl isomerase [Chloroflexota bacterium]